VRRIVLDSSVLIDASRGDPRAVAFLRQASGSAELWSVAPVRTEVLWNLRPDEVATTRRLFDSVFWLDVTTSIADRAGAFGQRYGRSHGLDVIDATIAAAAEEISGDVATLNVRHFPMFPGLPRPY
jgi:predicted nucleic acid-binding protein